jgi:Flp pilus assembly protein TadD
MNARGRSGRTSRRARVGLLLGLGLGLPACLLPGPPHPEALRLNQLGAEHLREGRVPEAEAALAVSLEYHPRHAEALYNLALAAYTREDFDRAEALLDEALDCQPDLVQAHNLRGALARRAGRLEEACLHFEAALELDPGARDPRRNLILVWLARGRPARAAAQLLRLEALAPEDAWLPALRDELARAPGARPGR